LQRIARIQTESGKVAEWSNAPDSKSGVQLCCTVSSNLTLSASKRKSSRTGAFFLRAERSEPPAWLTREIRRRRAYSRSGGLRDVGESQEPPAWLTCEIRRRRAYSRSGGLPEVGESQEPPAWLTREIRRRRAYSRSGGLRDVGESHSLQEGISAAVRGYV
jgi:hypothetical protein